MTNRDYVRDLMVSQLEDADLVRFVEEMGCDQCFCKMKCDKEYLFGTSEENCQKIIKQWLRQERE